MTLLEKPSQLPAAIGGVLKSAFPQLYVGNHHDFPGTGDKAGILISVERNGPGVRSLAGRKAHALSVSLKAMVASGSAPFDACDLASQLMDLALDNRWACRLINVTCPPRLSRHLPCSPARKRTMTLGLYPSPRTSTSHCLCSKIPQACSRLRTCM